VGISADEEGEGELIELKPLGHVELALFTGQFTRDEKSGIDFLVVGDINPTQLGKYIGDLESKEGKEIRYVVMTRKEFDYRRQVNDRFLITVLDSKMQVLTDKINFDQDQETSEEPEKKPEKTTKKNSKKE
jgi:hypothetical protein